MPPTKKAAAPTKKAIAGLARFKEAFGKNFGADTFRSGGEIKPYEVISTGSVLLDFATGIGGLPEGRLVEWWGPDGSGKTTLALLLAAQAQKKHLDKIVGYVDMEQSLDLAWAKALGVDVESETWGHVQPDSAEDLADIVKSMLESGLFSVVIVDSIGGMITEEEMRKDAEKDVVGTLAKVVTRMVKIAAVESRKSGTLVLLLNQVRANIGGYGFDETTGGGWALRHGTSMRMRFRRTQSGNVDPFKIGSNDDATSVGYETAVLVEKNKCAPPKKRCTLAVFNQASAKFGDLIGIDQASETANLTSRLNLLEKSGSWYIIDGEADPVDKVNGTDKLRDRLRTDPDLLVRLRDQALSAISHLVMDDDSIAGPLLDGDALPKESVGFQKGVPVDEGEDVLAGADA